jgi:hypothetical protein
MFMSEQITIPEELFHRIQGQAIAFVDLVPADVIKRWADHYDATYNNGHDSKTNKTQNPSSSNDAISQLAKPNEKEAIEEIQKANAKRYNPMNPPELFRTRVTGHVGNKKYKKWNEMVRTVHVLAFQKVKSLEALQGISKCNIAKGNKRGVQGFHYVPEVDASIQGVDATKAWVLSLQLAKYCELPIEAFFTWHENPKAAFPGESGLLQWAPSDAI